jgi:hypothetical protein
VGALVLDFLLVIIFLMMVPIGFYRGGIRELCVSAGLLLGILMSQSWGERWADLLVRMFDMGQAGAAFLMSVIITFSITALIGYGGSAAFTYRPGPGGRLYGAYLALFNAMIASGYLINLYSGFIVPATDAEPVTSGLVSRALSDGFGSVLLVATIGISMATIFGMFVRERTDDAAQWQAPTPPLYQTVEATRPYQVTESESAPRSATEPVRILEVQNWQEGEESPRPDPSTYGSGWRQTWPEGLPAKQRNTRSATKRPEPRDSSGRSSEANSSKSVLADWIKDHDES